MNWWFLAFCAAFILCSSCLFSSTSCLFLLSYFSFQNCMFQKNLSRNMLLFIQFSFYSNSCSFTQEIKQHWTTKGSEQRVELLVHCHKMQKPLYPFVDCSWNVMAHGDAQEGKWRGNWRMEWVASTLHATSEHGVSSITTAVVHTSAASSRLNWCPCRFNWTCPFRWKTKFGFCVRVITFQMQSTSSFQCCLLDGTDKSIELSCVTLFCGAEWSDLNSSSLYHVCPCEKIVHHLLCKKLVGSHDWFWMAVEGKWLICHLKPCRATHESIPHWTETESNELVINNVY
jgi:hypothetical protein